MSSRFRNESLHSRLSSAVLVLAMMLAPGASSTASAQDVPTDGLPFDSVVDGAAYLGTTPLRVSGRSRGFGEEQGEMALGTHLATPTLGGVGFVDGQFRVGDLDQDFSVNFGGGFRWRNDDYFFDSPRIFGVSVWYDGEDTRLDNYFNQIGVSLERLGPMVDLRLNANIPLEERKNGDDVRFTGETVFTGNNIGQQTLVDTDVSLRVVDFEVAPRLFNLNAWGYGGGYQMDGDGVSEFGYKAGVRGYIYNDLALDVGVSDDDVFGTNTVVQLIWTPGRVAAEITNWTHNIDDRMREHVYRNAYVAVGRTQTAGAVNLTDATGNDIRVVHVDSTAAPGGDGSIENPLNNLNDINDNSQIGDIVLAHSESVFVGQSAVLQDSQRFLGEGLNNQGDPQNHTVFTSELGLIPLPASSLGAREKVRPLIQNSVGDAAIVLAGGNDEVNTLAEIEVSNFRITGGTRGVYSPDGVGDVNINQLRVENTTGDGIELTPLLETLANNTEQLRFTPTINEIIFDNVGGDDIDLNGTSAEPSTTPTFNGVSTISNITSDDGDGVGIRLTNLRRGTTISNFDWDGGTTGEGALRVENLDDPLFSQNATVTMNGTNTITGGIVGTAGEGYGIRLQNGVATVTVTGTTITNTGGDSIIANDGTADLNFTGRVVQELNNASLLSVENGHDGDMTFTELTAGAGVMRATMGDGLQFNDADGTYTFADNVDIEGTGAANATAAVTVTGDSTGVITLTDATFDDVNGDTITFVGGTANMTLTGLIDQTENNFSILDVSGGHDGTLAFNGPAGGRVINATMGDGLQFNDADGAYNFNDEVDLLQGISEGISVTNGSSGTFALTDTANNITNPTGHAIEIVGSDPIFTYAGEIDTDGDIGPTGHSVLIQNNSGGSVTITAAIDTIDGGLGILVDNSDNTDVLFSGQVTLATGTNDGVRIQNNGGVAATGSTRFNALDIVTTSGIGFNAFGNASTYEIVVAGAENTIATDTGVALNLTNVNIGTGNVNFDSVSVANGDDEGIILTNVTGGAVIIGAGNTTLGEGGTIVTDESAIVITNAANVSINHMDLTTTEGFPTVNYSSSTAAASMLTLANNEINNTDATAAGDGVSLNASGGATAAVVTLTNNDIIVNAGTGLVATNTSAANANLQLSGTGNEVTANTGVGVDLNNVNIAAGGLAFDSVDVTAGATNGIVLTNITGGPVTVGSGGAADGDGGTMTTAGAAVVINNAANTTLSNMVLNSGASIGVDYNVTTAAASTLALVNNDINTTSGTAVDLSMGAAGTSGTVTLTNNEIVATTTGVGITTANAAANANLRLTGSGNTVATVDGVAVNLNNVNVSGAGLFFNSVSASNAATSGMLVTNVTGAVVSVGAQGASAPDGGTINATGSAVVITNSANVSLNNMQLTSTAGQGVDYNVTSAALSRLTLNGNNISNTALEGVSLDVSGAATNARITISNNLMANTSDDEALLLTTSGATAKTVNISLTGNDISNDSATAPAASFIAGQATTLNANITTNNQFSNSNAAPGQPFRMESATGSSIVRLNLDGNNATAVSGPEYFLVETAGTFSVEDLATVDTRNGGEVDFNPNVGAFTNDPGNIPLP